MKDDAVSFFFLFFFLLNLNSEDIIGLVRMRRPNDTFTKQTPQSNYHFMDVIQTKSNCGMVRINQKPNHKFQWDFSVQIAKLFGTAIMKSLN